MSRQWSRRTRKLVYSPALKKVFGERIVAYILSDPLTSASCTATTTTEPRDKERRRAVLTPGGADVVFSDVAASAKAGQATVPKLVPWWQVSTGPTPYLDLSLPASSSAAPKAKAARKDYVPIKRTTPAVFYKPYEKPKGTLIAKQLKP